MHTELRNIIKHVVHENTLNHQSQRLVLKFRSSVCIVHGYICMLHVLKATLRWARILDRGAAVAQWLRCWTLNSRVVSSRLTLGTVRFRSLGNFVYPTLPQSTQLQMSTNTVWKVPAMD